MKNLNFALLAVVFLFFAPKAVQAQTFEEYIALFPTITADFVWENSDLEEARASKDVLPENMRQFVNDGDYLTAGYPLGKLQMGSTYIVFMASPADNKDAENSQIALLTKVYNKKGVRQSMTGVMVDILAWSSRDIISDEFDNTLKASYDFKKKTLIIETKSLKKGKVVEDKLNYYKVGGKGFNLSLKDSKF